MVVGCVSQQSHERALQEYETVKEASAEKIERLQQVVDEKQAELEHTVEVQDQLKEQQLGAVKQELEALYAQVQGLANTSGKNSVINPIFGVEPLGF